MFGFSRLSTDPFHSTKRFKNFEQRTNDTEISVESFQLNPEIAEFPKKRVLQLKIAKNSERKVKRNRNSPEKSPNISIYLTRLFSFPQIPKNAVSHITGNFPKLTNYNFS